ncbi:MAG: pilus assembly protein PilM [Deltaproteobacteria bacterium]|nr:pilus assembly protein PilM [Deltaproteobacteria bacterium]
MALFGGGKQLIGLDIGTSSVKLVELKPMGKKGYQLLNLGISNLPPDTIVDGDIINTTAVSDAIKSILSNLKIKSKSVATSVSGHSVIMKKINMPITTDEALAESIQWEAEQYITFNINEVNLDYQVLERSTAEGQMSVFLVAAKKELINNYVTAISEAGLNIDVIDIDVFSLQNMFDANYSEYADETVAIVNVGSSITNFNVVNKGIPVFARDLTQAGGNQITEEIQKGLNISREEAEKRKTDSSGQMTPDVIEIIKNASDAIAADIQRSIDFYLSTGGGKINRIMIGGGTAKIADFTDLIAKRTGIPVEIINPFKNIAVNTKVFDINYIKEISPIVSIAVGLSIRRSGD